MRKFSEFSDFDYKNARNDWNHAENTPIPQISREISIFILFYNFFFLLFKMRLCPPARDKHTHTDTHTHTHTQTHTHRDTHTHTHTHKHTHTHTQSHTHSRTHTV